MLILKTFTRLALPAVVFLAWTPIARAWSWPVQGPVLRPFAYDEAHPYASGQHRGLDIGADAAGEAVVAPAAGTVSFAGTVPTSGVSVTIQTADGYSVTLTHLGSILVARGAAVTEGEDVGTIGPSGMPEQAGPYLHLGIRVAADPNGYVDPLTVLPAPTVESPPGDPGSTSSQPASGGASAPAPAAAPDAAPAPAPAVFESAPTERLRGSTVSTTAGLAQPRSGRVSAASPAVRRPRPSQSPAVPVRIPDAASPRPAAKPRPPVALPARSVRRPVVKVAAPPEPVGLGAGHELRPSMQHAAAPLPRAGRRTPSALLPLVCNGLAALVALAAALLSAAADRRRRRRTVASAQVLELPLRISEGRRDRRAA